MVGGGALVMGGCTSHASPPTSPLVLLPLPGLSWMGLPTTARAIVSSGGHSLLPSPCKKNGIKEAWHD